MSRENLKILFTKLDLILIKKTYICSSNNLKTNKMSDFKHKPGSGSAFKNTYKDKETQPDYKGSVVLKDGTEQQLAIWIKEGNNGKFFSIALSDVYVKPNNANASNTNEETDLPF
tara:strand:- start:504 stop:848 length:345 start_codon:yes stop_codon:yes gene_type:complete